MHVNLPYIDRIWRARGEVLLDEPLTPDEAFDRLDPLFQTAGSAYAVEGDTLGYSKHNPAAQDKLATFTRGTLRLDRQDGRSRLVFDVSSTALLLCFLAPLLFLGFAQTMVALNAWDVAGTGAVDAREKDKEAEKPKVKQELHPLDKLLGAPEPDDPDKKKDKEKDKKKKEKFDPTRAYVLAGLFFVIYLVGRVLEPWLFKRTLRAALAVKPEDAEALEDARAGAGPSPQPEAG
ncbi:hypothetical protein [Erythrobacter sp.]|uniref:hypothetical protein n=1 Tax=Erythrobacter sp. TaxID=1042 RepID=UPI0025D3584A|nr:hypothetical protein [Erythrobacter sp.]